MKSVTTKKRECVVCSKILQLFKVPLDQHESFRLGSRDFVLSLSCTFHKRLLFGGHPDGRWPEHLQGLKGQLQVYKLNGDFVLSVSNDLGAFRYVADIRLLPSSSNIGAAVTGRQVHSSWISGNLVRRWKDSCDRCHGNECKELVAETPHSSSRPAWLVDVWRQCLMPGSVHGEYLALSYVWGQDAFFTATKDNIDSLQVHRSLTTLPVPRTIQDALLFVEKIGERYLWVDALCIVQDDKQAKYSQIKKMSSIFADASCTIIAAGSSGANSGLPGISTPRHFHQAIYHVSQGSKVSVRRKPEKQSVVWQSRAWTFQEAFLSLRRIVFDADSVHWECFKAHWFEDVVQMDGLRMWQGDDMKRQTMLTQKFPNTTDLAYLTSEYNTRQLSYAEDVLHAFSGILGAICHAYNPGFLSGLALSFFDIALLWQPRGYSKRRVATSDQKNTACLPSWSWAGWNCRIDSWSWSEVNDYMKFPANGTGVQTNSVIPLVQWYSHETLDGQRQPILAEWYQYKEQYYNTDEAPPPFWTKHAITEGSWKVENWPDWYLAPQDVPKYFYRHDSDSKSEFWYPIPMPAPFDTSKLSSVRYISCRTKRSYLFGSKDKDPEYLSLVMGHGACIGHLKILGDSPFCGAGEEGTGRLPEPLELVEIASGYGRPKQAGSRTGHRSQSAKEDYYYVMWIEWDRNVAYRKGLGTVTTKAWEAQDREWIDLTLG